MVDSSEPNKKTLSLFSVMCDVGTGKFPDIPAKEAEHVTEVCTGALDGIRCKTPFLEEYIEDAGGLNIESKNLELAIEIPPHYIPIIDEESARKHSDLLNISTIGLRLKDVIRSQHQTNGGLKYSNNPRPNAELLKLPVFQNKRTLLFSDGADNLIESLWNERNRINLFQTLNSMGFDAVTGPDFSVWMGACPVGQILNINKSLLFSSLMEKVGTASIPHFFAITPHQREIEVAWLNRRPHIKLITINCQMQKRGKEDLRILKETILYLINNTKQELHIILRGFSLTRESLDGILHLIHRLHFADSVPFFLAKYGQFEIYNHRERKIESRQQGRGTLSKKELIQKSMGARELFIEDMIRSRTESEMVKLVDKDQVPKLTHDA